MKFVMKYNVLNSQIYDYSEELWNSLDKENKYYVISYSDDTFKKEIWECNFDQIDDQENDCGVLDLKDIKEIFPNFIHNSNTYFMGKYSFKFDMSEEELFYYSLKYSWFKNWIDSGYIKKEKESKNDRN